MPDVSGLPTVDEAFAGVKPTPSPDALPSALDVFGGGPQSGAAHDEWWSSAVNAGARILNYAGNGASDAWGARPLGLDPQTEAALKNVGFFNDWDAGHTSFMKSVNEAFIRPAAGFADAAARAIPTAAGAVSGYLRGIEQEALSESPEAERLGVARKPFAAAVGAAGELTAAAGEGLIGPEFGFGEGHEAAVNAAAEIRVTDAAKARAVGAFGEGEAGYYDAAPQTPETVQARVQAANDAGIEPIPPEPPPPDIHTLARRIDPDTFEQYDALAAESALHRAAIARLGDERAALPEAVEAQNQIDTILGKVRGVEGRLTNAARDRLATAQERLDAILTDDTPEMRQARAALLDADFAMRDLAPDVSAAYRQARDMAPEVPAEAPKIEQAAGAGEKPGAEAEAEGKAGPTTPEQEAGVRAAPVEAQQAAAEGVPANVVGKGETLGEPKGEAAGETATAAAPKLEPTGATRAEPLPPKSEGPSPGLVEAQADVAEHRSARPPRTTIFQAIRQLGGLAVRDEEGHLIPGPDVQGALEKVENKPPGLINNKSGLSPEAMHEALAEQGWFGHGDIDPEALVRAIEKQARGEDVFHPDSGLAEAHARRKALDEDMQRAGVKRTDDKATAARKLAHYREVEQRTAERLDNLKARADEIGVTYWAGTTYEDLLADVTEREAIAGDATEHGFDTYEDDIDAGLTDDDIAWLNRSFEEQHGQERGAFGVPEDRERAGGTETATAEPAEGATGGGERPGTAGGFGRSRGDFGVVGTGETRTRGVSATTETRALENGLEQAFGDLPSYNQMSKAEQAARVVAEMDRDFDNAVSIAMGDREPPRGVLPESFYEGVRMRAIAEGDWDLTRRLATESKLIGEATTMGRRIAMYAARDPLDPVAAIKDVVTAREGAVKDVGAAKAREVGAIREEIATAADDHEAWENFLRQIEC